MDRVSFFSRGALRRVAVRAVAAVAFCGFAAASSATTGHLTLSGTPPTSATVGKVYSFKPTVSNPSGKTVKFLIMNRPSWASFSTTTGLLTGTPPASAAGTMQVDIGIEATVGSGYAFLPGFAIRVGSGTGTTTDKPTISGTPGTSATVGKTYTFQPTAKDPAGKTLSFSVKNKPAWASFSIASGLLDGTPTSSQTGTYSSITITASNGTYATALPAFNIVVSAAGSPPPPGAAKLTWVPPTKNTNGSALTDLAGVRIYYGSSASNLSHSVQVAGSSATTYMISGLTTGTWYFGAKAYTTTGALSAMSAVVAKAVK